MKNKDSFKISHPKLPEGLIQAQISDKIDSNELYISSGYNPVNQKIFGKIKKGKSKDSYVVDLIGHDNLGNEVTFFLTSVSGEDLVFKYENFYGDLSAEITSISLTPYASKLPEKSGKMSDDYKQVGEEFTISLKPISI